MPQLRDNILVGVGNPLLDMEKAVDKAYLEKYGLKENDAILAEEKHAPMFGELLASKETKYTPGGATQNSMRIAQWVWQRPNTAAFMGCIGNDEYGRLLTAKAREAGVNVQYQIDQKTKTGTCACLIYQEFRSLAADLAAANCFTVDHLDKPENKAIIEGGHVFYIAGFHLTVCPPAVQRVAQHALEHKKTFCMNLSAPFISQFFKEPLHAALPYVDILFGNETEAEAFAQAHEWNIISIDEIARKLASWEKKDPARPRLVVITQGPDQIVVCQDGQLTHVDVIKLPADKIVDTNGAGDAFVGGFLAQYVQDKPLSTCIKCGVYCATEILQRSGATVPERCEFQE